MSSNRREDELLNKLKNCLGSANNENINIKDLRAIKNTYCNIKQSHQNMPVPPPKNSANEANAYWIDRNIVKQPLRPANFNTALSTGETSNAYNFLSNNRNSVQLKHQAYNGKYDIPSSSEQVKPGKRYQYGIKDVTQQPPLTYQENSLKNRRLSHPHKELSKQGNPTSDMQNRNTRDNIQHKPFKNYRQEVEQRKHFIDNPTTQKLKPSAFTNIHQINSKEGYNPPNQYQSIRKQAQRAINKQTLQQYQQPQRVIPPSKSTKECIALAKLNRISQLNEKINDRIRNIISVFQQHKS